MQCWGFMALGFPLQVSNLVQALYFGAEIGSRTKGMMSTMTDGVLRFLPEWSYESGRVNRSQNFQKRPLKREKQHRASIPD